MQGEWGKEVSILKHIQMQYRHKNEWLLDECGQYTKMEVTHLVL